MKWPRVKILRVTRREKVLGVEDFRALSSKNTRELETIRVRRNKLLERIFSKRIFEWKDVLLCCYKDDVVDSSFSFCFRHHFLVLVLSFLRIQEKWKELNQDQKCDSVWKWMMIKSEKMKNKFHKVDDDDNDEACLMMMNFVLMKME